MQPNRQFNHPSGYPTQVDSFRSRKNPGFNWHQNGKRRNVDTELLESATEAVLKIVHRGKSQKALEARDRERERVKEHVLRTMDPSHRRKSFKECFRTRCLPETAEDMAKRKRRREQKKKTVEVPEEKDDFETTINHFSFVAPQDLSGLADLSRIAKESQYPSIKKQVSFISPEKPSNSFKTPSRPSKSAVSTQPPPLVRHKRETIIVNESSGFEFDFESATRSSGMSGESPRDAESVHEPFDLLGIGSPESIF